MWLIILLGTITGLALGLTGSGGSIFAVPMLVYGVDTPLAQAVAMSLLAVAATAAVGAARGLFARAVDVRTGLLFAATGILGAPLGVGLGDFIDDVVRLSAFALLMIAIAVLMWRRAGLPDAVVRAAVFGHMPDEQGDAACRYSPDGVLRLTAPCMLILALSGFATGVLSGLFGVGGGFLIVPALQLTTGLSMRRTVATSLLIIAIVSTSGITAYFARGGRVPADTTAWFIVGGLAGLGLGALLAGRLTGATLQRTFAVFVLLVGIAVLLRESLAFV